MPGPRRQRLRIKRPSDSRSDREQEAGAETATPPRHPLLDLQATIGNAATVTLMRQVGLPTPDSSIHPDQGTDGPICVNENTDDVTADPAAIPPGIDPKIAATLAEVRSTLSKLPRLGEADRGVLAKVLPGAPLVALLARKEELRTAIGNTQAQIGGMMPAGGMPQDDELAHEIYEQSDFLHSREQELLGVQYQIDETVRLAGADSELELTALVQDEFPAMFVRRAKEIAFQELDNNLEIAEAEGARFGVTRNPISGSIEEEAGGGVAPYIAGLPDHDHAEAMRTAASEILSYRAARVAAEEKMTYFENMEDEWDALQAGDPDPGGRMAFTEASSAEYDALSRNALELPMLWKIDAADVVNASDQELTDSVHSEVTTLYGNILATKKNISDDELEVWNLKDIVALTATDLSIPDGSPLMSVVDNHIRQAKADKSMIEKAKMALQITAAIVASVASGGTALVAGAVALGVGVSQLHDSIEKYRMEKAAENVALDPQLADISVNEPEIMPIVVGIVGLGIDAASLGPTISALRGPAKALLADGDLATFSAAAYKALPAAEADKLVARAALLPEVTARGAVGVTGAGTAWTHDQILELFIREFKRTGPPTGSIIIHETDASYKAVLRSEGMPENTAGFFKPPSEATGGVGTIHLPPTATTLTVMHESLHMISAQSGVRELLGAYVEEGLTEWLARSAFGPEAARFIYDDNVAFITLLENVVGEDALKAAYLHGQWTPLRDALRAHLGSDVAVSHLYGLLRKVGDTGGRGANLGEAMDLLWPGGVTP